MSFISILESGNAKKEEKNIKASCTLIYQHLMKFVSVKDHSKVSTTGSWIGTIFEQNKQLKDLNNATAWRNANTEYNVKKIQSEALEKYKYENKHDKEPSKKLSEVINSFDNIEDLKDTKKIADFLYDKLDPVKDNGWIEKINDKYKEVCNKDYKRNK